MWGGAGLSEEKAVLGAKLWRTNFLGVARAASQHSLIVNELLDMDWRFGGTYFNASKKGIHTSYFHTTNSFDL